MLLLGLYCVGYVFIYGLLSVACECCNFSAQDVFKGLFLYFGCSFGYVCILSVFSFLTISFRPSYRDAI